jgi:hypothetical protein
MSNASAIILALALWMSAMLVPGASSQILQADALPTLYGVKFEGAQIKIDVVSFGCTDASHFLVQLEPDSVDVFRLSVVTQKQDMCRMRAHIVTVTLDIPEVANPAAARFVFMNRFAASATLHRAEP